ncbi:hypothetical protein ABBQ38_003754 [Trebouxia sp. C0009 RCD-2024]
MQAVELAHRIGQGQGSRRASHAGASPRRQSSMLEGPGPRRQSSGSGSKLGLRRSLSLISGRAAPMQLEQLLTGAYTARRYALWQSRQAVLNAQLTGPTGASNSQLDTEAAAADAIAALGPVLESLMGMRGLPAAAATSLEDGVRGTNHPTRAAAREGNSEEEQDGHEDKLSPLPSWTSPHKTSSQGLGGRAIPGHPYLAKQIPQRASSLQPFTTRTSGAAGRADGGGSSSSGPAATRTFLRSTRTLQHRQSLDTAGSSSDSSLPSQKSGIKFGRTARVGALGVAAKPPASQPQAQQRGSQSRLQRPSSGRVQKHTASGGKSSSRPNSRGQAGQSSRTGIGTAKLKQLATARTSQEQRRRKEKM